MRLFRTEQAARDAGFKWGVSNGTRKWREDDDNNEAEILTDRERRLLEALESVLPAAHYCEITEPGEREAIKAAEALLAELAVEG